MPANHLEQIVAEWYEFQGYFVRRNVLVGKRAKGGYECELDVVAFHPTLQRLVQIEPSGDSHTWEVREQRFTKKFMAGRKYIPDLFKGQVIPNEIEQIAIFVIGSRKNHLTIGGGRIVLLSEFLREVRDGISKRSFMNSAISENMPLLRMMQMMNDCL